MLPEAFGLRTVPGLLSGLIQLSGLRAGTQEPWTGVLVGNLALAFPSALIAVYLFICWLHCCLHCFPLPSSYRSLIHILVFTLVHTADPAWLQILVSLL